MPAAGSTGNPVDMLAAASGEDYRRAIAALSRCDDVDALIVIFTPPLVTRASDVIRAIQRGAQNMWRRIPVLSVFMSKQTAPRVVRSKAAAIPHYPFPEEAARALSLAARYGAWRNAPEESVVQPDGVDRDRAAGVIATSLADGPGWMSPAAVADLLTCYGIALVKTVAASSPEEARRAATELHGPVALKAVAPGLVHKSDAGAVRLNLAGGRAVEQAASRMNASLEHAGHHVTGYLVQAMAPTGVEMLVGVVQDQHFGPVLACGAGGTTTELLKDVAVRITPITRGEAGRMVRSLKTFPQLIGYRGAPPADLAALEDVLVRVSALVEANPEVAEMDLNPLIVHPAGAVVVDARIRLEPGQLRPPLGAR
jgi:acyl-CoA synthetase (NDP forming)